MNTMLVQTLLNQRYAKEYSAESKATVQYWLAGINGALSYTGYHYEPLKLMEGAADQALPDNKLQRVLFINGYLDATKALDRADVDTTVIKQNTPEL